MIFSKSGENGLLGLFCATVFLAYPGCAPDSGLTAGTARISRDKGNAPAEAHSSRSNVSETFDLTQLQDKSIDYEFNSRIFTEVLNLTGIYENRTKEFQQIKRPRETRLFTQGSLGNVRSVTLKQENLGILDIQLIIDNSASMQEEQANLATKLTPLIKEISQSDWRINILSTDPKQISAGSCSRGLVSRGDANGSAVFSSGVNAGITGDGNEQGFRLAVHGLNCPALGWTRPSSSIAVLIVSDEDNCSLQGTGCSGAPYATSDYLLNYLSSTGRTLKKDARVYGLIKIPGTTSCSSALNFGYSYQTAINNSGGGVGSICDADYTAFLAAMSKDLVTLLKAEFDLPDVPNSGSLKLYVNNVLQSMNDYKLTGKRVEFVAGKMPPPGATIVAEYRVGAPTPIQTGFPLGEAPLAGTVEVLVNGTIVDPASYTFDAATNSAVFKVAPPELATVKISYIKNVPLSKIFNVGEEIGGAPMVVMVNNMETKNYKLLPGTKIEFAEAPADGVSVAVKYKFRVGPKLEYPLALRGSSSTLVGLYDKTTGASIDYTYSGASVILRNPTDVVDGRPILVRYKNDASSSQQLEFSSLPMEGSLTVRPKAGECVHSLENKFLSLKCNVPDGTLVEIGWKQIDYIRSFTLHGVPNPDKGHWKVWIDGMETVAFNRQDRTIILSDDAPTGSKVSISFIGEGLSGD